MSNPLINRWGLNLFWYNFWYTDKNLSLIYNLDFLINKLIFTYIKFGLNFEKNIFFHNYWFKFAILKNKIIFEKNNIKYFRVLEHKNKITGELTRFFVRSGLKDISYSKLWILKYQNWIVITLLSFQPLKKKQYLKKRKKNLNPIFEISQKNYKKNLLLFRLKLKLSFLLKNSFLKSNLYYFF